MCGSHSRCRGDQGFSFQLDFAVFRRFEMQLKHAPSGFLRPEMKPAPNTALKSINTILKVYECSVTLELALKINSFTWLA